MFPGFPCSQGEFPRLITAQNGNMAEGLIFPQLYIFALPWSHIPGVQCSQDDVFLGFCVRTVRFMCLHNFEMGKTAIWERK